MIDASVLSGGVAVSGNNSSRVMEILSNSTVMLNSMTIINGSSSYSDRMELGYFGDLTTITASSDFNGDGSSVAAELGNMTNPLALVTACGSSLHAGDGVQPRIESFV